MEFLWAGFVLSAVLVLFNLVLTFGVIRRLRELQQQPLAQDSGLPAAGTVIAEFEVTTSAGAKITTKDLADGSYLVGFFSAWCKPCQRLKTSLLENPVGERMIAFVDDPAGDEESRVMAAELSAIAAVVIMRDDAVTGAFNSVSFPTLVRVTNGVITAAGHRLADIARAPVPVTSRGRAA
jgi:hypothetical protein